MIMALPLLPPNGINSIVAGFQAVENFGLNRGAQEELAPLLQYTREQWVRRVGPQNLSLYSAPRRTNNASEGSNNGLRLAIGPRRQLPEFLGKCTQTLIHCRKDVTTAPLPQTKHMKYYCSPLLRLCNVYKVFLT